MKKIATIVVLAVILGIFSYNAFACTNPTCNCACDESDCSAGCTECEHSDGAGCCTCCAPGLSPDCTGSGCDHGCGYDATCDCVS